MSIRRVTMYIVLLGCFLYSMLGAKAEPASVTVSIDGLSVNQKSKITDVFRSRNTEVDVQFVKQLTDVDIREALLFRDPSIDIFCVSSRYGFMQTMASKGMFVDLSQVELLFNTIKTMYPQFQNLFSDGEAVFAFPWSMHFETLFCWQSDVSARMGLSSEKTPNTLDDLMMLHDEWMASADEDIKEKYAVIYTGATNSIIYPLLCMYRDASLKQTNMVKYDTPVFRRLLETAENYTNLEINAEDGGPENTAIYFGSGGVDMVLNGGGFQPLSLTVDSSLPAVIPVYFKCLVINPYGKNVDLAKELIVAFSETQSPVMRAALASTHESPIYNPQYDMGLKELEDALDECAKALTTCEPADRYLLEEAIRQYEQDIAIWEKTQKFLVNEESLHLYRERIIPNIFLKGFSIYESQLADQTIYKFFVDYSRGAYSTSRYIEVLDETIRKISIEQNRERVE